LLKDILEHAVPGTLQDVVLVFCAVTGWRDGLFVQKSDARKIYHAERFGDLWSAIQISTASALCAVLDLKSEGRLPSTGFVRQEDVSLPEFLDNRFGAAYAQQDRAASLLH
jgi:saccharopine dehydrogenase-like NADP-dependent oxidoreductase